MVVALWAVVPQLEASFGWDRSLKMFTEADFVMSICELMC